MTDLEPTPAPETDDGGEAVILRKSGWVALQVGEHTLHLDAPTFGQYRTLRTMAEDVSSQIEDAADEVTARAAEIEAEEEALAADESLDTRTKDKRRRVLRREAVKAGRTLTQMQEPLWLAWWAQAIQTLGRDTDAKVKEAAAAMVADHDLLPSYMAAAGTAMRVLGHWRAGPLGRG